MVYRLEGEINCFEYCLTIIEIELAFTLRNWKDYGQGLILMEYNATTLWSGICLCSRGLHSSTTLWSGGNDFGMYFDATML